MNNQVGSAIESCPGNNTPVEKSADSEHKNCAIKILSIKEPDGEEYKDSQSEILVKTLDEPLHIYYEVKACSMKVTLWIEYDPANKIHSSFYEEYQGKGVIGKRVVIVLQSETKAPGCYHVVWDGRDKTQDHRILLDGTYKVRIQGLHEVTLYDNTSIKFSIPFSSNFGIHYHKKKHLHTTKKEVEHARDKQKQLLDGTAYDSDSSVTDPALFVWGAMRTSSIILTSTHSTPWALYFYPEESTSGQQISYKKEKTSLITTFDKKDKEKYNIDMDNTILLPREPEDSLRDVFLVILAGCKSGNETLAIQKKLEALSRNFNPAGKKGKHGVDGKHGPKTTAALQEWQQWENIQPSDGNKNQATLTALNIDQSLNEKELTKAVQKKLQSFSKRYNLGKTDGVWGKKTETALTNYQEDHTPILDINSLPDKKTIKHLRIDGAEGAIERNMIEAFIKRGCNVVFGFRRSVSFNGAEKWNINFWNLLAEGIGIEDAATEAKLMCGNKYKKDLDFNLKAASGVDKNATLHPARYGRDLF